MKIVKEHITNFERPSSKEDFKDNLFGGKLQQISEYVDKVIYDSNKVLDEYDEIFKKYPGTELDEDEKDSYSSNAAMVHVATEVKNILTSEIS